MQQFCFPLLDFCTAKELIGLLNFVFFVIMNTNKSDNNVSSSGSSVSPSQSSLVGDLTSTIEAFESGTFYETFSDNKIESLLGVSLAADLDAIQHWIDSALAPTVFHDATRWDTSTITYYCDRFTYLKNKFARLCHRLNTAKGKKNSRPLVSCNACSALLDFKQLPYHEHFQEYLSTACGSTSLLLTPIEMANKGPPVPTHKYNTRSKVTLTEQVFQESEKTLAAVEAKLSQLTLVQNKAVIVKSSATCHPSLCAAVENCNRCGTGVANKFQFNFEIKYHPTIEKLLYSNLNNEMPFLVFQNKTKQVVACLVCRRDIPGDSNLKMHAKGQKHIKNTQNPVLIEDALAYHHHWKRQEPIYQAHQTFFFPLNTSHTFCMICNSGGLNVPYEELEAHVNSEAHKESFLRYSGRINRLRDNDAITVLQRKVYSQKETRQIDTKEEDDSSDEDEDDSNSSVVNNGIDTNQPSTSKAVQGSSSPQANANSKTAGPDPKKLHSVFKSVKNEHGKELADLLDRRFLPHLKSFVFKAPNIVSCISCRMMLWNSLQEIRQHICLKEHQINIYTAFGVTTPTYRFYCEICNNFQKANQLWYQHLASAKHKERCDRLGSSRKSKLTIYECETCKLVFFGDELSKKRHLSTVPGKFRYRRGPREVKLTPEVENLFRSQQYILECCRYLVDEAIEVLLNQERVMECCLALENALKDDFPDCKAYPFGSRVSGLGNKESDLDLFVDLGGMYSGRKNQDSSVQGKFVRAVCRALRKRKREFKDVNPIPTARTPIVQVFHTSSRLDCDLSFRHGLSVENTKFLRLCVDLQPRAQALILILKQWVYCCKVQEHITTYALSMMVIFYLQLGGFLVPVQELRRLNPESLFVIDGWGVVDFSESLPKLIQRVKLYSGTITDLLKEFFSYYSRFDYANDVICPLLGQPIAKSLFTVKPKGEALPLEMLSYVRKLDTDDAEHFRSNSPFCIQDPFDLSHNLVKACTQTAVDKIKTLCELSLKYLSALPNV